MRVLIDYRPALRDRSGAGEYTHQLVKALLRAGAANGSRVLELTLFSSSWKDRLAPGGGDAGELAGATIVDRRVPVRVLNFAWHRLGWPPAETIAGRSFDVTHSPHPLLLPAHEAAQVVTIHDLHFLSHPERSRAEIRRDYPALARDHARRADRVIVPSRYTAGEVESRLGVPGDRISICPPGAPDWKPRSALPEDGYVLFMGTLEPRKNLGALLDAYEQLITTGALSALPSVPHVVIAGRAVEGSQAWLDRIHSGPLNEVVRHVGYVETARRRELYEGARVLVQPSFEEGFGLPVLEAMTLGVPVIAASRGALPEVVGDAGLLIDPENPAELAEAIRRVLCDDEYAGAWARRGVAASSRFRWDITAERVYDTYRQACDSRAQEARRAR